MDINFIKKVLPHRYPFLLVDRILICEDEYVKALKNVTANEEFFSGHFPTNPVMPGVLMIEALAQTSCFMAYNQQKDNWGDDVSVLFMGISEAKFRRVVVPGDQLIMEAKLVKKRKDFWWMDCTATVDGEIACAAQLSAVLRRGQ
ncbi:MAG: 3-hydroxyacyl-ACP dehydratase FabZ [Deferribacteraceae bacterium]|nr:3-hydroxyacyl-ACP dehydratase FabZ [Deferribacteraceae bacterium]